MARSCNSVVHADGYLRQDLALARVTPEYRL